MCWNCYCIFSYIKHELRSCSNLSWQFSQLKWYKFVACLLSAERDNDDDTQEKWNPAKAYVFACWHKFKTNNFYDSHLLRLMMVARRTNWRQTMNAILFITILIEKNAMCPLFVHQDYLLPLMRSQICASENAVWLIDWRLCSMHIGASYTWFDIRNCSNNNNNTT